MCRAIRHARHAGAGTLPPAPRAMRLARRLLQPDRTQVERMPAMDRLDQFFGVHGQALALRGRRLEVIASNIANSATPGYKARDIDFPRMLHDAAGSPLSRTHARHLGGGAPGADRPALAWRVPNQTSLDGNTVELATEQMAFADTAVRYRSTLAFLGGRIQSLQSALRVD
jgi:flagellar basal-body rod protein FlgB